MTSAKIELMPASSESTNGFGDFAAEDLNPIFWRPNLLTSDSAWWGHVPFGHWVVAACRPRILVELGTHNGISYASFCEAVLQLSLNCSCYAVDTWSGDHQTGCYDESVYETFNAFNAAHFGSFSRLLRMTFDDASTRFDDRSVDFLHIDGLHTYDAVKHDFEVWKPKLSNHAVVIFHDINVREADFGVWRLWGELRQLYPSFEFIHAHGLGVLGVGGDLPTSIKHVFSDASTSGTTALQRRFCLLGERWQIERSLSLAHLEVLKRDEAITLRDQRVRALDQALAHCHSLEQQSTDVTKEISRLQALRIEEISQNRLLKEQLSNSAKETGDLKVSNAILSRNVADLTSRLEVLNNESDFLRLELTDRQLQFNKMINERTNLMSAVEEKAAISRHLRDVETYVRSLETQVNVLRRPVVKRLFASFVQRTKKVKGLARSRLGRLRPKLAAQAMWQSSRGVSRTLLIVSGEPDTPGHLYRVVRLREAARQLGWQASVVKLAELSTHIDLLENASAIYVWRAAWDANVSLLFGLAKRRGKPVAFDLDDLMIDTTLAKTEIIDGIRSQGLTERGVQEHYQRILQTMVAADLCIATTDELARHMRRWQKPSYVLPNGFDNDTLATSRLAMRRKLHATSDGLVRIGYAGGSRTHQRDFGQAAGALAKVLRQRPNCRLVLFRHSASGTPLVDIHEFAEFSTLEAQIEWRSMVDVIDLPTELARFDINIAPLETDNPFCEAKSELKIFEAALAGVCTIASPTGPFARAIRHGETGLLANTEQAWCLSLMALVDDPTLRARMADAAYLSALALFGPLRRAMVLKSILKILEGKRDDPRAIAHAPARSRAPEPFPIADHDVIFEFNRGHKSQVCIVIPLYNYERFIVEALESVRGQTLVNINLVVVDDASTDTSLNICQAWVSEHRKRFNRVVIARNKRNSGLANTRNVGFFLADSCYCLPLDADNRLLPRCCEALLDAAVKTSAAFVYPTIREFGDANGTRSDHPFDIPRLTMGNYIDAMALVSLEAWACVGGYTHMIPPGWEDYDFWCLLVEKGHFGQWLPEVLAEYRVHAASMLHTTTNTDKNRSMLRELMETRHSWLSIA